MPGMSSDLPKCVIVDCSSRKVNRGYCGNLVPIWVRCCKRKLTPGISLVCTLHGGRQHVCVLITHTQPPSCFHGDQESLIVQHCVFVVS